MDSRGSPDDLRASLTRVLGERYTVLRLLGQGGMGAVYLARDESLERLVAVKVLRPELAGDEASRERFRREARAAARLRHPGIVPLFNFGEAEGVPFLVMGYVRGETLAARLRRDGRMGVEEARRIVADIADALDVAHRQGVVHRDVKPDNVILDDESGRALLTDFGVARLQGGAAVTGLGAVVGTPLFMSPEQAAGQETVDGRSDLYSLGATAFLMLAGRPPFEGTGAAAVMKQHLTAAPPRVDALAPEVPPDLAFAVDRCLRKDPAERFPDGAALRAAVAPGDHGEQLPEPLDDMDGFVPRRLPVLLGAAYGALYSLGWGERVGPFAAVITIGLLGLLVTQVPLAISAARLARARGITWSRIGAVLLRQPAAWPLWYPRRWRRSRDVYDRLPAPFRAWRVAVSLAIAALALGVPFLSIGLAGALPPGVVALRERLGFDVLDLILRANEVILGALLLLGIAIAASATAAARLMHAQGLDTYTLRKVSWILLYAPTAGGAWKRPELALLLAPGTAPAERPPLPQAVPGAVAALAAAAPPSRVPELEAIAARAHEQAAELVQVESDLATLLRETDPAEVARLEERRARLRDAGDADAADLRDALDRQLALVPRLRLRRDEAETRRTDLARDLLALWAEARRRAAPPGPAVSTTASTGGLEGATRTRA